MKIHGNIMENARGRIKEIFCEMNLKLFTVKIEVRQKIAKLKLFRK